MNKNKKSMITTLTLILLISMFAIAILPSSVKAVQIIDTNAYAMLSPDLVGVGQTVVVSYRIDKVRQGATDLTNHFEGFSVTITKPDGTIETKQNLEVDSTSGSWFTYVPTEVGTYTFVTHFPEQWANGTFFGQPFSNLYLASDSAPTELTVQADPIPGYPGVPLPTEPWRRPINAENKGWWQISGNWLMENYDTGDRSFCMTSAVVPFSSAPNSAHILWKKPIVYGGMAGGDRGDTSYFTGLSYEQFYLPLILEGRIIYVEHGPTTTTPFGTAVLDLYTGEEVAYLEGTTIAFAQVLNFDSPNEHGTLAYLWSLSGPSSNTTMIMYDAFTLRPILTVTNVPWGGLGGFSGGGTTFGPNGEILSYRLSTGAKTLTCWNSTKAIYSRGFIDTWSPGFGSTIDGSRGIEYNVTIPTMPSGISISAVGSGYVLAEGRDQSAYPWVITSVGFNQATGQMVWTKERTDVYTAFFAQATSVRDGMYVVRDEGEMTTHAYDITTGNKLWETEPLPNGWGIFEYQRDIAYGKVYTTGYTGDIRAYDAGTGALVWAYDMGDAGYETVYGVYPTYNGFTIADNKIFVGNDEHSPDGILWRGSKLHAVDTETGEKVWDISGMFRNPAVADGLLTALNSYDGQVYTFGRGPSKTTVSAPSVAVEVGQTFTITGTVTDQTPASKDTPAISDEDMTAWMEYLHMQKPIPGDAIGVPVSIDIFDPNGNFFHIGDTTSDMSGCFGLTWAPEVPGLYQVMATFAGSESYGSSYASTYLTAVEAPQPTAPPESTPAPMTDTYLAGSTVAIIAAIAIAVILLLRKK
ncbi:MAG: PQQ-binding-like beta-propeller repeat protein [Candidatus Bathyarchaeota archaeon]|nr:PQQ-binding-like beta-propeller repeat protein [Candidatus Bathyarchaeota archaeon]